jgi:hypothetical protein
LGDIGLPRIEQERNAQRKEMKIMCGYYGYEDDDARYGYRHTYEYDEDRAYEEKRERELFGDMDDCE